MKKILFTIVVLISISLGVNELAVSLSTKDRTFLIEERILFKNLPKDASDLRIWIPYPVSDNWQAIDDFKLVSPFKTSIITDEGYGNKVLFLKIGQNAQNENTSEIIISFKVKRVEYSAASGSGDSYKALSRFLKPDKLVPVNGRLKALAKKITQGKSDDLERVRAIYDYIIDELTYSKDDPMVCGIGDSLLTLEAKKGICTDYHSLFISLARSLGIPAKFEIGYRIPEEKSEGMLNGYHCWAKFYLKDRGWIPVDISEADKHPEQRDYFFGHIDENRVHFTTGRDIKLKYAKNQQPLNFFIYPYAELDNSQFYDIDFEVSFKNLEGGDEKN